MARVTVEDCVLKVPNRFDLVMLAAQRARDIASGAVLTLDRDNDKNPVVALREIADETIDFEAVQNGLIKGYQRQVEFDEPEEELPDLELSDVAGELTGDVVADSPEGEAAKTPEGKDSSDDLADDSADPEQLVAGALEDEDD